MIDAAIATLERLANEGWRAVAGDPPGGSRGSWNTVIDRGDAFDPFADSLPLLPARSRLT
jgi:hypothetical protein